jgi:hypothetical protein
MEPREFEFAHSRTAGVEKMTIELKGSLVNLLCVGAKKTRLTANLNGGGRLLLLLLLFEK